MPPGSDGLIMLPYIYGERSPLQDAEATGMLFGLKGTHGRAQINRAALEAVGYSTYQHLLLFEELGVPPRRIITAGGGTKNAAWMQIICDMAGMPLTIPEPFQCSSYGDACWRHWASVRWKVLPPCVPLYRRAGSCSRTGKIMNFIRSITRFSGISIWKIGTGCTECKNKEETILWSLILISIRHCLHRSVRIRSAFAVAVMP